MVGPDPNSDDALDIDRREYLTRPGHGQFGLYDGGMSPDTAPPQKLWTAIIQVLFLLLLVLAPFACILIYIVSHSYK